MENKEIDERVMFEGANQMAEQMFNFFRDNEQFQPYTFGIIGYATELLIRFIADQSCDDYDQLSNKYRNFLEFAHKDTKAFKTEDLMAN